MKKQYCGVVQRGERRGTVLGFPTANIAYLDDFISGIYAARVRLKKDEASYMAAVYADQKRKLLEAHLLDFNDELYGCEIDIVLLKKIRDAAVFGDDIALRAVIKDDIARVREYFG